MLNTILTGWNFVRFLRLFLGFSALAAFFSEHDAFVGILGAIVSAQAVFNVGCCGTSTCSTDVTKSTAKNDGLESKEIVFEQVK